MNQDCLHCPGGIGLKGVLEEEKDFWIVADIHPITRGHILIIPKKHIPCIGALSEEQFREFQKLHGKIRSFLIKEYGSVVTFEHGVVGQTVHHAHVHFLPFTGSVALKEKREIKELEELRNEFKEKGRYLFLEMEKKWIIDVEGYPSFFRIFFSNTVDRKERANWKEARKNSELMGRFKEDMADLERKWKLKDTQ